MPPELAVPREETCCDMLRVSVGARSHELLSRGAGIVSTAQMGPEKQPWHTVKCTRSFLLGCHVLISLHPIRDI